jgi:uncharacterized protein (TIGR03435 family)
MLSKVIAATVKAREARRRYLLVFLFVGLSGVWSFTLSEQSHAIAGPLPLEQEKPESKKLDFEVASVRLNDKWKFADPGYSLDSDDNYVSGQDLFIADAPLSTFIAFAYKLDQLHSMISNLPKWANEQTFEIRARVPGMPGKDQVRLMMRALLVERFQLSMHFEKQEKRALALTLIKAGTLGPGLRRHDEAAGCKMSGDPPRPEGRISAIDWLPCNQYLALDRPNGAVFVAARNTTMRQLCAFLSNVGGYGRTVVDQSGITEPIDFRMEFTKPKQATDVQPTTSEAGTLEEALADQLGVKLTRVNALLDIPIVDQLNAPAEN